MIFFTLVLHSASWWLNNARFFFFFPVLWKYCSWLLWVVGAESLQKIRSQISSNTPPAHSAAKPLSKANSSPIWVVNFYLFSAALKYGLPELCFFLDWEETTWHLLWLQQDLIVSWPISDAAWHVASPFWPHSFIHKFIFPIQKICFNHLVSTILGARDILVNIASKKKKFFIFPECIILRGERVEHRYTVHIAIYSLFESDKCFGKTVEQWWTSGSSSGEVYSVR